MITILKIVFCNYCVERSPYREMSLHIKRPAVLCTDLDTNCAGNTCWGRLRFNSGRRLAFLSDWCIFADFSISANSKIMFYHSFNNGKSRFEIKIISL